MLLILLVACHGMERRAAIPGGHGGIQAHLRKTRNIVPPADSLAMPVSFAYSESKGYTGDSALFEISPRRDSLFFSYASYFDGSFSSVGMRAFGEFKLFRVGPSSFELICKIQHTFSDAWKSEVPAKYSLNVIAKPNKPFPPGHYRLVVLKVIPNRDPITAYESKIGEPDKVIRQDPEFEIVETWESRVILPNLP